MRQESTANPGFVPALGMGRAETRDGRIKLHGPEAFEGMRKAGRLAAETLDFITPYVRPGVATGELDRLCHDFTIAQGAIPAPLNYRGFPNRSAPRSTTSSATASPATGGWSRATSSTST